MVLLALIIIIRVVQYDNNDYIQYLNSVLCFRTTQLVASELLENLEGSFPRY